MCCILEKISINILIVYYTLARLNSCLGIYLYHMNILIFINSEGEMKI